MKDLSKHLCFTCKNAKIFETEDTKKIYVSFGCKYPDIEHHAIVVRLPRTNHVVDCPKYIQAGLRQRIIRKFFWWI